MKRLAANRLAGEQQLAEERRLFEENSATLQGLRQKAELFARRRPVPAGSRGDADDVAWMARQMSVSDEEVEIAYLREQDSRSAS